MNDVDRSDVTVTYLPDRISQQPASWSTHRISWSELEISNVELNGTSRQRVEERRKRKDGLIRKFHRGARSSVAATLTTPIAQGRPAKLLLAEDIESFGFQ